MASLLNMKQRPDGGFNFYDGNKPINVNQYVQGTGTNKAQLVQSMASRGDRVSQQALQRPPSPAQSMLVNPITRPLMAPPRAVQAPQMNAKDNALNNLPTIAKTIGNFTAGANEQFFGGLVKAPVNIANYVGSGFNQDEANRRTKEFLIQTGQIDRQGNAPLARNATRDSNAFRMGQAIGTTEATAVDLAAMALPSSVIDKAVKGTKLIQRLSSGGKLAKTIGYGARVLPGSLAATGANIGQTVGRAENIDIPTSVALGTALDMAIPLIGKIPGVKQVVNKAVKSTINTAEDTFKAVERTNNANRAIEALKNDAEITQLKNQYDQNAQMQANKIRNGLSPNDPSVTIHNQNRLNLTRQLNDRANIVTASVPKEAPRLTPTPVRNGFNLPTNQMNDLSQVLDQAKIKPIKTPMTRQQREGGYIRLPGGEQVDKPLYHGSPAADSIRSEGFKKSDIRNGNLYGEGTYLTTSRSTAKSYAEKGKDIVRADIPKDAKILRVSEYETQNINVNKLKQQGYDGIEIADGSSKHNNIVMFDPNKIKVKKTAPSIKRISNLTDDEMNSLTPSVIEFWKNEGFSGVSNGKRTLKFGKTPLTRMQREGGFARIPGKKPVDPLIAEAKKYKSADEFARQFEYHGGPSKLEGNKLSTRYDKSGGIFTTPSKDYADVFNSKAGSGSTYHAYIGDKRVIDLTNPKAIGEVKNMIGSKYVSDGETMTFTKQDFEFLFPNGKADWATFSQYIPLLEKNGYSGARIMENSSFYGKPVTSTSLFSDVSVLPKGVSPTDLYNQAHKPSSQAGFAKVPLNKKLAEFASRNTEPTPQVGKTPPKKPFTPISQPRDTQPAIVKQMNKRVPQVEKTVTPKVKIPIASGSIKVTKRAGEKNIRVSSMSKQGDRVISTNVNPNIKSGEKRFALDDAGELVPDTKGAYRLFTDKEGRVTNFRVGDELFSTKDLGDLSKVNDYGSSLATMRRNIERGFGKETGTKVNAFLVDHQQAQATKMIKRQLDMQKGMKAVQKDLGISFGIGRHNAKKVSAAIQDYGEGLKTKAQLVDEFGADKATKIVKADKWFRNKYDTLLDEMNKTLKTYGYSEVPKRANYYTHFQEPSLWQSFGLKMQEIKNLAGPTMQDAMPEAARGKISNKLAGESEFTLPNKKFNKFALERKGTAHTADAFGAFERYLTPTLNNIYMTPSITRARVLARAVAQDADIMGKDANKIIIQTKEWANRLAGKSNRFDRPLVDSKGGQYYLKAARRAQSKAGANTIVGNLSTAVMQPIVLAQASGRFGFKNTILGALQELTPAHHGAGAAINQSEFMARRYTKLKSVTRNKVDRSADVANLPLQVVEETASRIAWNAAHNEALSQGLIGKKAINYADINVEKTIAGRSIGERPEMFESKAAGPVTMYQLEVNNYWQQFAKEMTKTQAAKTIAAAYGLNLLLQAATGRQVGFNPIDAAIDSYQEIQKDKPVGDKAVAVAQRLGGEVVDNIPFVGPIANSSIGDKNLRGLLGPTSNIGRFGVSSPIGALMSTTNIGGVEVPLNAILPYGGGQIKKTYEGAQTLIAGKKTDKNGKTLVNVPQTGANITRGLAFGNNAITEVNQYYDNLGKKKVDQTAVQNQTDSSAANMGIGGVKKTGNESLDNLTADNKARTDAYKKSFSNEDWVIQGLSKADQQKLVSNGTISQAKLTGLNNYATAKRKELGYSDTTANLNPADTYAKHLKDYQTAKKDGTLSGPKDYATQLSLAKEAITSKYSQEVLDFYGMSKANQNAYFNQDRKKATELYDQAKLLDAQLVDKKFATTKFKYGLGTKGKVGRRGGKSGSKGKTPVGLLAALNTAQGIKPPKVNLKAPAGQASVRGYKKAVLKRYNVAKIAAPKAPKLSVKRIG